MENKNTGRTLAYVFLIFYLIFLVYILFLKNQVPFNFLAHGEIRRSSNLVPFLQIRNYLYSRHTIPTIVFFNVIGNIAIFFPLGIYLPYLSKYKNFFLNLTLVILISLAVEVIQYATGLGAGDVDDVILNGVGGFLGLVAYKTGSAVRSLRKSKLKTFE